MTKVSLTDDIAEAKAATEALFMNSYNNRPMETPTPDAAHPQETHMDTKRTALNDLPQNDKATCDKPINKPRRLSDTILPAIDVSKERAIFKRAFAKSIEDTKQRSTQKRAVNNSLPKQSESKLPKFEEYPTLPSASTLQLTDHQAQVKYLDADTVSPSGEHAKLALEISGRREAYTRAKRQIDKRRLGDQSFLDDTDADADELPEVYGAQVRTYEGSLPPLRSERYAFAVAEEEPPAYSERQKLVKELLHRYDT